MRRRKFACHDTGRQFEAAAESGIETLRDQVDLTIIEMPVRRDRRVFRQERRQQRHHVGTAETGAHADLEHASRLSSGAGQIVDCGLDRRQSIPDFVQKAFTGLGQGQAARASMEQPHTQSRLQPRHVLANRGRGHAKPPGCLGKTASFGATHETLHANHGFHSSILNLTLNLLYEVNMKIHG